MLTDIGVRRVGQRRPARRRLRGECPSLRRVESDSSGARLRQRAARPVEKKLVVVGAVIKVDGELRLFLADAHK